MGSPMVLHFYGPNNEEEKTFTRTFVPWKLLKEAVKLQKLDQDNLTEEDVDKITNLMVSVFGGQFTAQEAEEKADVGEMLAVLTQIVTAASGGLSKNPIQPGK